MNRNFHFGFTARTSIPAFAPAGSVFCIRFHPKGSGRPERAVPGTQKPGIALFPGDFSDTSSSTPLLRPDWFRFAATGYYPPGTGRASMRRSMFRTGPASDGSLPTIASSSGHALTTGRESSPSATGKLVLDDPALAFMRAERGPVDLRDCGSRLPGVLASPMLDHSALAGFVLLGLSSSCADYRPDEIELLSGGHIRSAWIFRQFRSKQSRPQTKRSRRRTLCWQPSSTT